MKKLAENSSQIVGRAIPGAMELVTVPLRIAILISLLITAGGLAWACLARIPVYVNGMAYMIKLGDIRGRVALTDGQVHYQFSATQLIQRPLFSRLYALTQNPQALSSGEQITALSSELLKTRPDSPILDINSTYTGLVPKGQLLVWIDSPLNRNQLNFELQSYIQANRDLGIQRSEVKILNGKINLKIKILKKQLESEVAYLRDISSLVRIGYSSRALKLSQQSKVDSIKTEIINAQEELTANAQKTMQAEAMRQEALVSLQEELNNFVARNFIFATSPVYIVDILIPQLGLAKYQDSILNFSSKRMSGLPDEVPGFLSLNDANQVSRGMKVMLTPSGMQSAQFGGILGTVQNVNRVPSNLDQIASHSGSMAIAEDVSSMIPDPVRVDLLLERDPHDKVPNHAGFRWSSPGSPPFAVRVGDQLSLQITTLRVRPITLLIPFLLKASGVSPPSVSPRKIRSNQAPSSQSR
jgi:hypothetical protein